VDKISIATPNGYKDVDAIQPELPLKQTAEEKASEALAKLGNCNVDLVLRALRGAGLAIVELEPQENFANAPVSIAELRSDRNNSCIDWTPRDMLICMLREHDSGKTVLEDAILCYKRKVNEDEFGYSYVLAGNGDICFAMLHMTSYRLNLKVFG